jgi:hypothetical protein
MSKLSNWTTLTETINIPCWIETFLLHPKFGQLGFQARERRIRWLGDNWTILAWSPGFDPHITFSRKSRDSPDVTSEPLKTPWPSFARELYWPRDRLLSAKLVLTFVDRRCHVVNVTNPYGCNLDFLDRSRYFFFFQVAPEFYSRGWVDPVPDPLLLRKSGSVGNRTWGLWICSQELWPLDHRGGRLYCITCNKIGKAKREMLLSGTKRYL